jgi:hypothetical protein
LPTNPVEENVYVCAHTFPTSAEEMSRMVCSPTSNPPTALFSSYLPGFS